uniref:Cysteine sulfinic acid decarboxylase n=1 Tax=Bactrocera latifrons TaxID=174628 RepID=A0A0K8W9X2_BACLA
MLASNSLPTHYNESIFKKHLQSVDNELAGAATLNAPKTEVLACSLDINGADVKGSAMRTQQTNGTTKINNANNTNNNNNMADTIPSAHYVSGHPDVSSEGFIRNCMDEIIKSAVLAGTNRGSKVVEWRAPSELQQLFDFNLKAEPETHAKLIELLKATIKYSVKTGHPYFINQLYSGVDVYALIGQWLTDALNPSVYTYEVAPIFTLMEETVLAEMRRIVGFPNDGYGDGIFCPGGSIANGYGISCARYKYAPETKVSKCV